jgi:hypothetical protein
VIITKECYDCGSTIELREEEVYDGIVARPVNKKNNEWLEIWLCSDCRVDAEENGCINVEDVNIVDEIDP